MIHPKIDARLFALAGTVRRFGERDWTDPYVGMRVSYPLNDRWTEQSYVSVDGFGAGSNFTWPGIAGLDHAWPKSVTMKFGYRYMKVDYDKGGFRFDMENDGLYPGVGMRF